MTDELYRTAMYIIPLWALTSFVLARLMQAFDHKEEVVRSLWITVDLLFLTYVLLQSDGYQHSPLLMLYPIYIVGASLWNRVRAVWLATVLCILSNLVLFICAPQYRSKQAEELHVHLVFIAGLIVIATMAAHQVRQTRLMRRYIREQHPLVP